jgi:RimJ/RimL family protein N-acetyltransferase
VTVRRGGPEDARGIAEVHVRTWQAAYRHAFPAEILDRLSVDEREAQWREWLDRGANVWVAVDEESVVGFAAAGPSDTEENVAELFSIYVLPEHWGSGAAHELMAAVTDWFRAKEYTSAMLWVLADNPRARRFYEREGWRFDGTRNESVRGVDVEEARYRIILKLG